MTSSLYDISVASYLQTVGAVAGFLEKGRAHCEAQGIDLNEIVQMRLYPDMLPFTFQIVSVAHHSLGALKGLQSGKFGPPGAPGDLDFAGLQNLVAETLTALKQATPDAVNSLEGSDVVFEIGDRKMPFTCANFVLSFSLPNLHFHATTAYDMLRIKGVPLGKRDYMGMPRIKM
ncbi:MAG: DUF1993 domain-containing protein [Pseudomonadales bacterium]